MITDLQELRSKMQSLGVTRLLMKRLAPNDNSKNQPYFGPDLTSVGFLPTGKVSASATGSNKPIKSSVKFLVDLNFYWLSAEGDTRKAPHAKLIYYPQYPEVRFSGFLRGCSVGPNALMNPDKRGREEGRILFIGVDPTGKLFGYLVDRFSTIADQVGNLGDFGQLGVFDELPLGYRTGIPNAQERLLEELCRISSKQWIESKRLDAGGLQIKYQATNGGGFTLEAELGIIPNGISEPDFLGWEVKQFAVSNFERGSGGRITLMTPEPTGGVYKTSGVERFVLNYGYPDLKGRDRLNFCGLHKAGARHSRTGLTLMLPGFDAEAMKLIDPSKGLTLFDDQGNEAAVWSYSSILEHWKRKHAKAVYVPSKMRKSPSIQYRYSPFVRLGVGTGINKLLEALVRGEIVYDPGVVMKNASSTMRPIKRRSQFRVLASNLVNLYDKYSVVDACNEGGSRHN